MLEINFKKDAHFYRFETTFKGHPRSDEFGDEFDHTESIPITDKIEYNFLSENRVILKIGLVTTMNTPLKNVSINGIPVTDKDDFEKKLSDFISQ